MIMRKHQLIMLLITIEIVGLAGMMWWAFK